MSNALTNGFTICLADGTNSKHSITDLKLAMGNNNYIGDPEQETYIVDVPGRSGLLDMSEALTGGPVFKNRKISIEVGSVRPKNDWDAEISAIRNLYDGRVCKIVFDNDASWYWTGRVRILNFDRHQCLGTFTIEMDANAYKQLVNEVEDTYETEVGGHSTVTLRQYTPPLAPVFTVVSGNPQVVLHPTGGSGQTVYNLSAGDVTTIPGLMTNSAYDVNIFNSSVVKVKFGAKSL